MQSKLQVNKLPTKKTPTSVKSVSSNTKLIQTSSTVQSKPQQKKILLYGSDLSTCTNATKAFLKANKIEFDYQQINIFNGENKSKEFTALNPLQKVPVLNDNGLILRESMVLCRYICNSKDQVADHWYPKDPRKRALVDLGLEYWSQNSSKFFAYAIQSWNGNTYTKEEAKKVVDTAIEDFERLFLQENKFVGGGDKPSLADLPYMFYLHGQTLFTGLKYDDHRRFVQWVKDCYDAVPAIKEQAEEYTNKLSKN